MNLKKSIISIFINAVIMALLIEYDVFNVFTTQTFFGKVVICLIVILVTQVASNILS